MTVHAPAKRLTSILAADPDGAVFSDCGDYRYLLWRELSSGSKTALFIGLNPSTADASTNDPTIRRMLGFARDWGSARLVVANVFAYRATQPRDLFAAEDPQGPDNPAWLQAACKLADRIICCWGNQGHPKAREYSPFRHSDGLSCLSINATGAPAHPLYQPASRQPRAFEWPA